MIRRTLTVAHQPGLGAAGITRDVHDVPSGQVPSTTFPLFVAHIAPAFSVDGGVGVGTGVGVGVAGGGAVGCGVGLGVIVGIGVGGGVIAQLVVAGKKTPHTQIRVVPEPLCPAGHGEIVSDSPVLNVPENPLHSPVPINSNLPPKIIPAGLNR